MPLVSESLKTCKTCLQEKVSSEFHKAKSNKDGLVSFCKVCAKAFYAARHIRNIVAIKAQKKRYREAHRSHANAKSLAWRLANPDRVKELNLAYYAANAERERQAKRTQRALRLDEFKARERENHYKHRDYRLAKSSEYAQKNKDKIRLYNAIWCQANPEKKAAYQATRRARALAAGGSHSGSDIKALVKNQRGCCAHPWCRASIKTGYHVDHILPLALGGTNHRRNIQLLCALCNVRKGAKHPIDFAQKNGLLL